ncbi:Transposon Polyprotein integrase [Phytophthora palmivora]|uniref:Transposon Polyprotein integrase n=1 Tax=Phytophthora palmivora TaxID=4796 RepID=A0A2P4YV81_9STRA|nr:Transposon Polyprotein integrase [Phytophthora palmivora]
MPSSKTDGRIPYELWYRIPSMTYMKVSGCSAYVHITEQYRDKLDVRAWPFTYLGIPGYKNRYRLMDINTHAIVYSRDVVFKKDEFPLYLTWRPTPALVPPADVAPATTPAAGSIAAVPHRLPSIREALDRNEIHYPFRTEAKYDSSSPTASKRPRLTNDDEEVTLDGGEDQQEQEQRRQLLYTLLAIRYVTEPPTYPVEM